MHIDAVLILIGVTCAASVYAWSNPSLTESWVMSPYLVRKRNEWHRFLTSGFLHADISHLAFNMLAFYSLSRPARYYFADAFGPTTGLLLFLLLYLGGIVLSDVPTYFKHRHDPDYRSLGASGGVSSVIFASILFEPTAKMIVFPLPIPIPGFIWAFVYLAYTYYQSRRIAADGINHDAHLYGALYGIVLTLIVLPETALSFAQEISNFLR
ncbi:rhomboid family intramembrane serine protease [Hymenobacter busanensis]|uniref:Rhomboid family intramembrane serine protease n=1 Tax=Hymenobacter busanensis TaxID=2607656 RepID=A0A7L5A3E2_9BACT|nr:rhomboid family intramembrane serine protease [Hymenobacter busanensis]KAA9332946.1 rhomboid family intramembrane serine protease [Hymenobacter busanensis]QHJ08380.1 rhomboid family intramembrane serine protease [Hymenobacter busanensis]